MLYSHNQQTHTEKASKVFWFDFAFFCACAAGAMMVAHFAYGREKTGLTHLGGEYFYIAKAITEGKGFSDPFGEPTGATAWMPPLLPFAMATFYRFVGFTGLLTGFLVAHVVSIAWSFATVVSMARRFGMGLAGYVIVILIGDAYSAELFCCTHDSGILLLFSTLTLSGVISKQYSQPEIWSVMKWGVWGGLVALASPALGVSWAVMTAWLWVKTPKAVLGAALVSIVVISPWCIRNYLIFDHWIPIKSNAGFDAWQANVDDEDGVIDQSNTDRHPINHGGDHLSQMQSMGEYAYNRKLGNEFKAWVVAHPVDYLAKIGRRLTSSVMFHENMREGADSFWVYYPKLLSLAFFCLTIAAIALRVRVPSFFAISLAFLVIYLLPYWLISYYERYGAPMVTVKAFIVLGATIGIRDWYRSWTVNFQTANQPES
jgi:hypothetical protein